MIKPLENNVIIKVEEEKSTSGIVIPDSVKEKSNVGVVVAVGSGLLIQTGERIAPEMKVGDKVFFVKGAGMEIKDKDQEYLIFTANSILAVLED